MTGLGCSRSERSTFKISLEGNKSICAKFQDFFIFIKPGGINSGLAYWLVTAFQRIPPSYVVSGKDPSIEFDVVDTTRCFQGSLSMVMQPSDNLKDVCDQSAGIISMVSNKSHIHCTIRQDSRKCNLWIRPVSGVHHDHQTGNDVEDWDEIDSIENRLIEL